MSANLKGHISFNMTVSCARMDVARHVIQQLPLNLDRGSRDHALSIHY